MYKTIFLRHLIQYSTLRGQHSSKRIADVTKEDIGKNLRVRGWIKSKRAMKNTVFLDLNDGSGASNFQVLTTKDAKLGYGASIAASGVVSEAPSGQLELKSDTISVIGECPLREGFPFVPKQVHPPEYIRERLHLRTRVSSMCSTFRIRHHATNAFAQQMHRKGYWQIHTPVITTNDCEGGGEVFVVKPDSSELLKKMTKEKVPMEEAYFDKKAFLSVSGQLHLEAMCHGMGNVFSFGPIFRAENSKTPIHLSEFYMLEAEQSFVSDISDLTNTIETLLKDVTNDILNNCSDDLAVATKNAKVASDFSWLEKPFATLTYKEAQDVLASHADDKTKRSAKPTDGLSKEQELFLVRHVACPVFVLEWPKELKPFYTRPIPGKDDLVDAVDLLVPFVGELVGGSVREDDYDRLRAKIPVGNAMDWYLELRKYGGVRTGGFGIGFERYLQWILGNPNIKDVIPFPRWAHNCSM